jgi:hypothetical protein
MKRTNESDLSISLLGEQARELNLPEFATRSVREVVQSMVDRGGGQALDTANESLAGLYRDMPGDMFDRVMASSVKHAFKWFFGDWPECAEHVNADPVDALRFTRVMRGGFFQGDLVWLCKLIQRMSAEAVQRYKHQVRHAEMSKADAILSELLELSMVFGLACWFNALEVEQRDRDDFRVELLKDQFRQMKVSALDEPPAPAPSVSTIRQSEASAWLSSAVNRWIK